GMGLNAVGNVTIDDQSVFDNTAPPDTIAPTSSINCGDSDETGCSSGYYGVSPQVTLSATDIGTGVASIRYTTDGSTPTSTTGTVYSGPFTLSTTSTVK